jgi:hypothetical protein
MLRGPNAKRHPGDNTHAEQGQAYKFLGQLQLELALLFLAGLYFLAVVLKLADDEPTEQGEGMPECERFWTPNVPWTAVPLEDRPTSFRVQLV